MAANSATAEREAGRQKYLPKSGNALSGAVPAILGDVVGGWSRALGTTMSRIAIVQSDTDRTGYDTGAFAATGTSVAAKAVEPHTTQSGFLFFDIGDISSPLAGAELEITGVRDARGSDLLYFEIFMDKYLNAPKNP